MFVDGDGKTYRFVSDVEGNTLFNGNTKKFINEIDTSELLNFDNYCYGGNLLLWFKEKLNENDIKYIDSIGDKYGFERIPMEYECKKCGRVYEEGTPCHTFEKSK